MNMTTQNLLVELFVEELPPKALKKLGEAFANVLFDELKQAGLTEEASKQTSFATPRRLAVHITSIKAQAADFASVQKLMPMKVAFDATKNPSAALLKKVAGLGKRCELVLAKLNPEATNWPVTESGSERLYSQGEGKDESLWFSSLMPGSDVRSGLQSALQSAIDALPIPKVMSYQLEGGCEMPGWSTVSFVRPAHGLMALHGTNVVPVQALGLNSGNTTQGHRFEAKVSPVIVANADSYAVTLLEDGRVIASFAERRADIELQLKVAAAKAGAADGTTYTPIDDADLLNEVTGLVERPNVLTCSFEAEFLAVPQECLILTMKANQKYFPLLDAAGKLSNKFLVVSNISPSDASAVIGGNERVVRPRLADAKFFFDQDRKKTLESRVAGLDKVVYHNKLGSQGERILRVRKIARWVAQRIGADADLADRAALLAKADLVTDMVGEFPELQGIMGSYYARHDGEDKEVVTAISDQYLLRSPGTDAANLVSVALVIADRVETLVGMWGIGLKPTGEKDPYALRRHALTVLSYFQVLDLSSFIDGEELSLDLSELLVFTAQVFQPIVLAADTVDEVKGFIYERYWNQLAPRYGVEVVEAVMAQHPPLHQVTKRLDAVIEFKKLPEAAALAAANKRISNILKKAQEAAIVDPHVSEILLKEPAEIALFAAMNDVAPKAKAQFEAGDYTASLQTLAALRAPVDAFFDGVMVNAEELDLRLNRQGLLKSLHEAMNRVADLSKLAT